MGVKMITIDPWFNKGADDQNGPEHFKFPLQLPVRAGADRDYWVGPLPGVDPWRTFLTRRIKVISPTSAPGKALIARGVAAMHAARPDWTGLPVCTGTESTPRSGPQIAGTFLLATLFGVLVVGGVRRWSEGPL